MENEANEQATEFYKHVIAFLLAVPLGMLRAWVYLLAWNWFFVPLGAFELKFFHLWGIIFVIGMFTASYQKTHDHTPLQSIGISLVITLFSWLVLWLIHFGV